MTTLFGQFSLLVVFSLVLGAVVSVYREDEVPAILRGTVRRGLSFLIAVVALGALSAVLSWFLAGPS